MCIVVMKFYLVFFVCDFYVFGVWEVGENCQQEFFVKVVEFWEFDFCWYFIGQGQINKVGVICCSVDVVYLVDRECFVDVLYCVSVDGDDVLDVLVQVNFIEDFVCGGVVLFEVVVFVEYVFVLFFLRLCGVMVVVFLEEELVVVFVWFCVVLESVCFFELDVIWIFVGMIGDFVEVIVIGVIYLWIGFVIIGFWLDWG